MENTNLKTEKLSTLMRKYSVPCVISLLVGALYNIVDQIFIANASYLGSYGNAANTTVFPLTTIALALAVMVGDGCCTFVSISMGRGDSRKAADAVGSAILWSLVIGAVLTVLYIVCSNPLLKLFGANVNAQTFAFAKEYFFWIATGMIFYVFGQAMNPIIRADGNPRFAMAATLAGAIANVILDPVMIYGFHWGMMGAAVATVIGQILTAVLSVWYLRHANMIHLQKESFQFHPETAKVYIPMGATSFLSQFSLVIAMAAVNSMIQKYTLLDPVFSQDGYTQIPMAVIGIVMKFFQIVISISVGMAAGCAPIAGYNMGAGENKRVKDLFILLLITELLAGIVALLIVEIFPNVLINLFGAANESEIYRTFAIHTFRIYLMTIPLAIVNKGTFIYLQALGKVKESTALSVIREVVFGTSLPVILPMFFGLDGICYSMPCADTLTFVISLIVINQIFHQLKEMDHATVMTH